MDFIKKQIKLKSRLSLIIVITFLITLNIIYIKHSTKTVYTLILPDDVVPFDKQVGGHKIFEHGKIGILKQKDGFIIKPVLKPKLARREMDFYTQIQQTNDTILKQLQKFLLFYNGTRMISVNGQEIPFLILEDIAIKMENPCIMDIKIGARTWDPLANYAKIQQQENECKESKQAVGFCIQGFQFTNISDGKLYKHGKQYGYKLNGNTVKDALKIFLNSDSLFYRILLIQFLDRLQQIKQWFRMQRKLILYSSSLLFAYDANLIQKLIENNVTDQNNFENVIKLKIIDFAHVFPNDENVPDTNYLHGIENLINVFQYLLNEL